MKTWDTPSHQPDKKLSWEEWQDEHSYNVTHFLATPTPPSVVKYQSGLTGHPTPKPRVFAARVICFLFDVRLSCGAAKLLPTAVTDTRNVQYWEVCTEKRRNIIKQKLASLISYLDKKPSPHVGRVVVVRLPAIRIPNRTDVIRDLSRAVGCSEPAVCLLPLENTSKHADCVRFLWHQFHIFRNKHPTTFNCGGVQLPCTACC